MSEIIDKFSLNDSEYAEDNVIDEMERACFELYFLGNKNMIPPYRREDVINIINYYLQKDCAPRFYKFEEVDRQKLDVKKIAQYIIENDMRYGEQVAYLNNIWNNEDKNIIKLFFDKKIYFERMVHIELNKISDPDSYFDTDDNVKYGKRNLEDLPL